MHLLSDLLHAQQFTQRLLCIHLSVFRRERRLAVPSRSGLYVIHLEGHRHGTDFLHLFALKSEHLCGREHLCADGLEVGVVLRKGRTAISSR